MKQITKAAIALAIASSIATATPAAMASDEHPDYGLAALYTVAGIGLGVALSPAFTVVAGWWAYEGGHYDGILTSEEARLDIPEQMKVNMDSLNGSQRQVLIQLAQDHAEKICKAQGMTPVYWQSVQPEQVKPILSARMRGVEDNRGYTQDELRNGGQHHDIFLISDIEIHGAARIVSSVAAWAGVSCNQIQQIGSGSNMTVGAAPFEVYALRSGGIRIRQQGSTLHHPVVEDLSWGDAQAYTGKAISDKAKRDF